jgi:hypothetical protein
MKIPQLDRLREVVQTHFGVDDLRSKSRKRPIPYARYMFAKVARDSFMYVLAQSEYGGMREIPLTLTALAEYLNVNHATVLHGIKTIEDLIATEKGMRESHAIIKTSFLEDGEIDEMILKKQALIGFRERIEIKIYRLEKAIKTKMEKSELNKQIEKDAEWLQEVKEFLEKDE